MQWKGIIGDIMEFSYKPQGVCASKFIICIDDDKKTINWIRIIGGCAGNTLGISKLVEGMKVEEVISKLKGIERGMKGTSCPNELAKALEEYLSHK